MSNDLSNTLPNAVPAADLSALLISLLRGVLYRDSDERLWGSLLNLQARIRDYISDSASNEAGSRIGLRKGRTLRLSIKIA